MLFSGISKGHKKMKTKTYDFYADPSHGWLKVSRDELNGLNILSEITGYSYQRNGSVYLEEDDDLSTFTNAMKGLGITVKKRYHHTNRESKIRSYESFHLKTLQQCRNETANYLVRNDCMTTEFDKSINDISRDTIAAMKNENGACFLGKINLYDDERKKPYTLVEYTGQKVYNFEYDFCLPCHDRQIETMIEERDKAPYTGTAGDRSLVEGIINRINELNGRNLIWS